MITMLVAGLFMLPFAAHATDMCSEELSAVRTAINDGIYIGKGSDQSNLIMKLEAAEA